MAYIDLFLSKGFDFPEKDREILNRWYEEEKERHDWGIPKLLSFEEAMEYEDYCSQMFDDFPGGKAVILWEAENMSAIGGYYYTGLLKGTVFLYEHDEGMAFAPSFLSLERFYDYYQRIIQDDTEDFDDDDYEDFDEDDYEDKFWHNIDFNDNKPLTESETQRFHLAALELLKAWKEKDLPEEQYEITGFCAVAVLPDCYAGELIPYLKAVNKDEYVLEAICNKLADARCVEAIDAMQSLWEKEQKGFRIGGWTSPRVAGAALEKLLKIKEEGGIE